MSAAPNAIDWTGSVALVTGASRGIGLETARRLAAQGFTVLLTARGEDKARAAAETIGGGDVRPLALDVVDAASVQRLAERVAQEVGRLDVLVNNAAAYVDWAELPSTADLDGAHRAFEVNVFGAWRVTQALLPLLRESPHGRIVNVTSGAGSHGEQAFGLSTNGGGAASYGISKAAANALTSKLAAELEPTGLRVNAVCPGLTATFEGAEQMGARPIADGTAGVTWAATLPDDGPTGGFFRDGRPLPW